MPSVVSEGAQQDLSLSEVRYYEGMAVAFDEAIALIEAVKKGRWE